jgi:hypothetical protein
LRTCSDTLRVRVRAMIGAVLQHIDALRVQMRRR